MITTKKSNLKKEIKKIIKRFPTAEIYQNEAIEELLNLIPKAKEEGKREAYNEVIKLIKFISKDDGAKNLVYLSYSITQMKEKLKAKSGKLRGGKWQLEN